MTIKFGMTVLAGAVSQQFILYNLDLLKGMFTFYHGKSALNRIWESFSYTFSNHLKQVQDYEANHSKTNIKIVKP